MIRAALFDFDGTLADSYAAITASVNHVRAHFGLPPMSEAEVRLSVGHGLGRLVRDLVPGADHTEAAALYSAHHPSVMYTQTRLLPGVADALPRLRAHGVRLAVCSNKPVAFTRKLVEALSVAEDFDAVLGPEDVARPKPAPDMLLEAMRRLGANPAEVVYVGDMTVDVETARAAGVTVWAVATGSHDRATLAAARPDRLLDDLTGLAALFGA
jgi:phosphoglycolate phosphatase